MTLIPRYIVIHHSATDPRASVEDIRKVHLSRGWDDIGYHFLIDLSGKQHEGRPLSKIGAHAKGINNESIGICCIGDFSSMTPPQVMIESLTILITRLKDEFNIEPERIIGHLDVVLLSPDGTKTECPGEGLYTLLPWIRNNS